MYSKLIFKSWRKNQNSGETLLSFAEHDELSVTNGMSHIERQQQLLRDQIHQSQESVEGLSGDGSTPNNPIIKPNAETLKFRGNLSSQILNLEDEKEYVKKLEYLINNEILLEKTTYNFTKKEIEKLYKNPKKKYASLAPNLDQIALLDLFKKLTARQWAFIVSAVIGIITLGYWIRPYFEKLLLK